MTKTSPSPFTIYLGDIVHKPDRLFPSTVPYNVARIAAYLQAKLDSHLTIKIFKDPFVLLDALRENPPNILALSNYFWNARLSSSLLRYAKDINPSIVTVQGGPNLDRDRAAYQKHAHLHPYIDFVVVDEGETSFANLVETLLGCWPNIDTMKQAGVSGCVAFSVDGKDVHVIESPPLARMDPNDIPSPYLCGLMDPFLDQGLEPIIETVRGCPYRCAFCEQGSLFFQKVMAVDLERVKAEIDYIRRRVKAETLILADVNFGILPRDPDLARYLRDTHEKYGFPKQLYVYMAKNPNQRTLEVAKTLHPLSQLCMSFQSTDETVLDNIHRTNIGYEKYLTFTTWAKREHIPVGTELIFGLPGESKQSFVEGIEKLMTLNSDYLAMYNLRLFSGIELNVPSVRQKYQMRTMFRPMDRNYGQYELPEPTKILECEEIVVESSTFSFEDFLFLRKVGFLVEFLWNSGYARPTLAYLQSKGLAPMKVFTSLLENLHHAPEGVAKLFSDYECDVRGELFESELELNAHCYDDRRWEQIMQGNGFYKINLAYTGKALLFGIEEFDSYLTEIVKNFMDPLNLSSLEHQALSELQRFSRLLRISPDNLDTDPPEQLFSFDIHGWITDNYTGDLLTRYCADGVSYHFRNPAPELHRRLYQKYSTGNQLHFGERFMMEIFAQNRLRRVEYTHRTPKSVIEYPLPLDARVNWDDTRYLPSMETRGEH